jgi:hypothetical protein
MVSFPDGGCQYEGLVGKHRTPYLLEGGQRNRLDKAKCSSRKGSVGHTARTVLHMCKMLAVHPRWLVEPISSSAP